MSLGMGWLNIGSFALGGVAWLIPIVWFFWPKRRPAQRRMWMPLASLGACSVSVYLQICYNNYLVQKEDFSALLDTTEPLVLVAGILVVFTVILNILAVLIENRKSHTP